MRRCFVDNKGEKENFWIIDYSDNTLYTIYGEAGKIAKYKSTKFDTAEECEESANKKIASRLKKGEIEQEDYTNYLCEVGTKNYFTKELFHPHFTRHFKSELYYQKALPFAPFDKSVGIDVLKYAQILTYQHELKNESYDISLLPEYLVLDVWKYGKYVEPTDTSEQNRADGEATYVSFVSTYCAAFAQIRITGKLSKELKQRALMAIRRISAYADEKEVQTMLMPMHRDLFAFLAEGETADDIKTPVQLAFEKNLKFLNADSYENFFFEMLFTEAEDIKLINIGKTDFPTGEVVLADPIAYLGTKYQTVLEQKLPIGSYDIELARGNFPMAGLRTIAARIIVNNNKAVRYELALPKGSGEEDKENALSVFGVDTGLASFSDLFTADTYYSFRADWHSNNPDKNIYNDYFGEKFSETQRKYPELGQRGDFIEWTLPNTSLKMTLFSSGMGDGIYTGYFGYDENNEVCQLVVPFMNPEFFRTKR